MKALRARDRLQATGAATVTLAEGGGGIFEIRIDGQLAFSKKALGRFPTDAEIDQIVAD
ncbi:MAG: Rdx family protein [Gammaproteobacteria bacterium]